jgi:hypothetical protein
MYCTDTRLRSVDFFYEWRGTGWNGRDYFSNALIDMNFGYENRAYSLYSTTTYLSTPVNRRPL